MLCVMCYLSNEGERFFIEKSVLFSYLNHWLVVNTLRRHFDLNKSNVTWAYATA
jgi:hypothetical protein